MEFIKQSLGNLLSSADRYISYAWRHHIIITDADEAFIYAEVWDPPFPVLVSNSAFHSYLTHDLQGKPVDLNVWQFPRSVEDNLTFQDMAIVDNKLSEKKDTKSSDS